MKTTTPTYDPLSDTVERWHRTLNTMLKVFMEGDDKEWAQYLPAMTLACNTKVHASTDVTPFYAMFGREARLPADLVYQNRTQKKQIKINTKKDSKEYMRTCEKTRMQQLEES